MTKYRYTEEDPVEITDREFTENQLYEVYRDMVDKEEYPDFNGWFFDMLKSGNFVAVK